MLTTLLKNEREFKMVIFVIDLFQEDHANAQTGYDEARSHHIHYENKKKEQERKIANINKQIDKLEAEIKVKNKTKRKPKNCLCQK